MDSEDSDSDDESYTTPPESNQEDEDIITIDEFDPMDANAVELTEDEYEPDISDEDDSELENILNNPSNDTTVELGNLLNLPDILDIQGNKSEKLDSTVTTSGSTQKTPTKRCRPDSPTVFST